MKSSHNSGSGNREERNALPRLVVMSQYEKVVSDLSERECRKLCRRIIRGLTRVNGGGLSGEDSGLRNVWDEICVQVQDQKSTSWSAYLDVMESLAAREVSALGAIEKQAIWLQTGEGGEWTIENEEQDAVCPDDLEIAEYVSDNYVLAAAADWTNSRIEKYLEREYDGEQDSPYASEVASTSVIEAPNPGSVPVSSGRSSKTERPGRTLPRWKQPCPSIEEMTPTQEEWDRAMAARDAELAAKAPRDKDGNLVLVVMPPNDL